jgi:murein DD-endopeptidase MepM/ murein hydrolase activator NlpD
MWYNLKNWNWLDATGDLVLGVVSTFTDTVFGAVKQIGNLFARSNNYVAWADIRKEAYGISGDADIENVRQLEEVANRIWMGKRKQLTRSEIEDLIDDMLDGKESYKDFVTTAMNECETDEDTAKVIVNNYILTWFKKRFITVNKLFVATICSLTGENPGDMLDVDDIPEELQGEALDKFAKDAMKFVHDAGADEFVMDTDAFSMYLFKHGIKELEDSNLLKGELSAFDKFDEEISNTQNLFKKSWDKLWSGDIPGALSDFGQGLWGCFKVVGRAFDGLGNYIAYKFADWFGDTVNEAQWKERFTVYNLPEPVMTAIMAGNGDDYISTIEDLEEIAIKILDGETSLLDSDTRAEVIDKIHELCEKTLANPDVINNLRELSYDALVEQRKNTKEKLSKFYLYWFKAVFLKHCALLATVIRNITHKKTGEIDVDDIPEDMSAEVLEAFLKEAKVINSNADNVGLNKESYLRFTEDSTKRNKNSAAYKQEQAEAIETQKRAQQKAVAASASGKSADRKNLMNFKFDAVKARDDFHDLASQVAMVLSQMGVTGNSYYNKSSAFDKVFTELYGFSVGSTTRADAKSKLMKLMTDLEVYVFNDKYKEDNLIDLLKQIGMATGLFQIESHWYRSDTIGDADAITNKKLIFLKDWYNKRFIPVYITLMMVMQANDLSKPDTPVTSDLVLGLDTITFAKVLKLWRDIVKSNKIDNNIAPTLESYNKSLGKEGESKAKSDIEELQKKRGNKPSPKEQREQAEKIYLADLKQKADARQISLREQGLFDRFQQAPTRQLDQSDVPQKYASGGIVWGETNLDFGIAGEAGPESVIPLRNDSRFDSLISESVGMVKGRGAAEAVSNILKGKAGLNSELPSKDLFKSVSSFFKSTSGDLNGLSRILDIDKLSARDLLAGLFGLQLMNLSLMGRGSLDGKMSTVVTNKDTSSDDTSPFSKIKNMFSSLGDSIANNGIVGTISNGLSSFMGSASSVVSGIANTFTGGSSNIKPASSTRGGSDVNKANMMKIWKALKSAGWTEESIAGLLGNIQKESGIESVRMQGDLARDRSKSNKYTANCENNKQSFVRDSVGYGLCQWTYPTRKAALYDFAHERNKSIGDFDTQVEFIKHEVSSKYPGVLKQVKSCKDVVKATEIILKGYEQPAKMNDPAELRERAGYAIEIYKMLSGVSEADLDAGIVRGSGSRNDGTMVNIGAGAAGSPQNDGAAGSPQNGGAAGNYQNDGSISNGDVVLPTKSNVITSQFGPRNVKGGSTNHRGIDLRARTGDPIFSMMDGVVQGTNGKYNSIAIDHGNGIVAKYLHNSQILTSPGQSVHKGDVIALAGGKGPEGATQYASHLHLGISKNGQTLDPEVFLRSHGIDLKIKDGGAAHGAPASDADTIGDSGSKAEMIKNPSIVPTAASNVLDKQISLRSHGIDLKIKDGGAAHGAPASDADTIGDSGSKAEMVKNLSIVPTAASNVLDRQSNISSTPFISHQQRNQISTSPVKAGEDMDASTVMDQQKLSELQIMANLLKDIKDILIADDKQEVSEKPQTVAKPSEDTSKLDKLITAINDLTRSISSKTDTGTTQPAPAVRPSASKERSFGFPLNIAKA